MLKREKEVFQYMLDHEEAVIQALEKHYRDALHDINMSILVMQNDELTQSRVYQLEYQKALKKQVEGILERMHAKEYTTIQQYLSDSYKDAFVGAMYAMHGQGIPIIAAIDQNAAVKAVLTDSAIQEDLYKHLAVGVDGMKKAIRQELTRGIASNMRYADIARNIESTTKAPLANAKNIVRTEGHRIQQASSNDAAHAAAARGADQVKQWDATLDGATRKIHRDLDGKIVELDEDFVVGLNRAKYPGDFGDAALDCQCRCVALYRARWALDEEELETLKERAAFFKLDKTEDFQDFKNKYLKAAEKPEAQTPEKTVKTTTTKAPVPLKKQGKNAIIQVKNSTLPNGLPKDGVPNSIVDKTDEEGNTLQRRVYNSEGHAQVDYDTSDHNRPDLHPTGAHKHVFDYSGKKPKRGKPEKLTDEELKQHSDIIKRGDNYHDEE